MPVLEVATYLLTLDIKQWVFTWHILIGVGKSQAQVEVFNMTFKKFLLISARAKATIRSAMGTETETGKPRAAVGPGQRCAAPGWLPVFAVSSLRFTFKQRDAEAGLNFEAAKIDIGEKPLPHGNDIYGLVIPSPPTCLVFRTVVRS